MTIWLVDSSKHFYQSADSFVYSILLFDIPNYLNIGDSAMNQLQAKKFKIEKEEEEDSFWYSNFFKYV